MSKTTITSSELAPPVGPFSQAVEVGGFLYFSGQVGQDPATGKVVEGGIVAETERVSPGFSRNFVSPTSISTSSLPSTK